MQNENCPVCDESIKWSGVGTRDVFSVQCPRCSNYQITGRALANLRNTPLTERQKANLSGWLFENRSFEITTRNLDSLFNIVSPSFHERADKILLALENRTEHAGQFIKKNISWISWGWCINEDELNAVLEYLESSSRLLKKIDEKDFFYKIIPNGWGYLEELKKVKADSTQGFVAMWFDEELQEVYDDVIARAILDAGYKVHRVDQREHNDKIDDEIIAQIRRSRFVVADFTGHRGGVYYEAGFAKGLGLEVFWTCRKDDIDNLHFDIRQYNCIDWEKGKLSDFRKRLSNRIERVLGQGNYQA